jgi:hypothetical protein
VALRSCTDAIRSLELRPASKTDMEIKRSGNSTRKSSGQDHALWLSGTGRRATRSRDAKPLEVLAWDSTPAPHSHSNRPLKKQWTKGGPQRELVCSLIKYHLREREEDVHFRCRMRRDRDSSLNYRFS